MILLGMRVRFFEDLQPRVALVAMLQSREDDSICWFGVKCSSSSSMNVGTSRRSYLLPEGDVSKISVQESNTLVSRCLASQSYCPRPALTIIPISALSPGPRS